MVIYHLCFRNRTPVRAKASSAKYLAIFDENGNLPLRQAYDYGAMILCGSRKLEDCGAFTLRQPDVGGPPRKGGCILGYILNSSESSIGEFESLMRGMVVFIDRVENLLHQSSNCCACTTIRDFTQLKRWIMYIA